MATIFVGMNATRPAAATSTHPVTSDPYDTFLRRALAGQASFAETMVLLHVAELEMRRSDARIRGGQ